MPLSLEILPTPDVKVRHPDGRKSVEDQHCVEQVSKELGRLVLDCGVGDEIREEVEPVDRV